MTRVDSTIIIIMCKIYILFNFLMKYNAHTKDHREHFMYYKCFP